ncbi:MAG TPA: phosphopantetheine-binding protein [Actinophytocola sp.]|uniref:phosphopantetheine-binding protein n=1 Tax=Actinophytocola sp. TaxID=1872138 RepID=UPI002DB6A251|nr:phosphopantetheine-binding protein [Actinophytocola sp.]HEU5469121.1 phosphopantetheine-binding protein [Actinophytocola sp.]
MELRQRVVDSIGKVLPNILDRTPEVLAEDTRLFDELGMSSSKTLELLLALEEELDIQVDVEEIERKHLESIGSLADFIAGHALVGE